MCSSGKAKRVKWSPVCVSSLFYIYGRWVKLLSLSEKSFLHNIYGEEEEEGKKRERVKEGRRGGGRKKNINGSWQLCKTTCWGPNWPWITLALFFFIFSLFFSSLFSSRYGSFSFFLNHFSAPSFSRDSDITPRFTHRKKTCREMRKKKGTTTNKHIPLGTFDCFFFFHFFRPIYIFLYLLLRERKSHSSLLL